MRAERHGLVVLSDLHGSLVSMLRLLGLELIHKLLVGDMQHVAIIMSEDSGDRDCWSLEIIAILVAVMLRHFAQVIMLRGNHEVRMSACLATHAAMPILQWLATYNPVVCLLQLFGCSHASCSHASGTDLHVDAMLHKLYASSREGQRC